MRVLHLINDLDPGGAQRLVRDLAGALRAAGLDVAVLTLSDTGRSIRRLRRATAGYDLIHVHLFPSLYLMAAANLGRSIPLVFTEHNTTNRRRSRPLLRPLERLVYSRYSAVACISHAVKKSLLDWLSIPHSPFPIIENGVDLSRFEPVRMIPPSARQEYRFLMPARFVPQKDHMTVLEALTLLPQNVKVLFAGDGPTLPEVRSRAEELGLAGRVSFLGEVTDIAPLLNEDLCGGILSSHWEGFGLAAVEMMATGLPVFASAVGGLKEVIPSSRLLFTPGSASQLASHIRFHISDDAAYIKSSKLCLDLAESCDISHAAKEYIALYNEILHP